MMDKRILQAFCSTEETRYNIQKPFSRGEFSYATNGYILVRVPRLADIPENEDAPSCERAIKSAVGNSDLTPVDWSIPAPKTLECPGCDGDNQAIHDCPDCQCMCETCGGAGSYEPETSCLIAGVPFDAKYIRMIAGLPSPRLATRPSKSDPSWFEFDGGIGCVVPLRTTYSNDIGELTGQQPGGMPFGGQST